jgi:hypothetical protein
MGNVAGQQKNAAFQNLFSLVLRKRLENNAILKKIAKIYITEKQLKQQNCSFWPTESLKC